MDPIFDMVLRMVVRWPRCVKFWILNRKEDVVASVRETEEFCMSWSSSLHQGQLFFLCGLIPEVEVVGVLVFKEKYANSTVCWRCSWEPTQH